MEPRARLIAFYLPQFHPIPENDAWWGKEFTEWTNVKRAKPLFPGHHQPKIPADLGYYDLRVPAARSAQAKLARENGISAFCYWHYWFGGKRLLERPFQEVRESREPNFPFCLAWANQSWTGIWHGAPNRILMEQTYPGMEDYRAHFYALLDAFGDDRYLKVDGKPLFVVYRPHEMPDPVQFTEYRRELAVKEGLGGLYLVGVSDMFWSPAANGFDACTLSEPGSLISIIPKYQLPLTLWRRMIKKARRKLGKPLPPPPTLFRYSDLVQYPILRETPDNYPCIVPNWDNTPRSGRRGIVLCGSTPELFLLVLRRALQQVADRPVEHRIIFVKSWNEWAEGNYLEPDTVYGHQYLAAIRAELNNAEY